MQRQNSHSKWVVSKFAHDVLANILIIISFAWNKSKFIYLHDVCHELLTFSEHTSVDIVIVTDNPSAVNASLMHKFPSFRLMKHMEMWKVNTVNKKDEIHKYDLLFEHKRVIESKRKWKNYTSFVYLEDDQLLRWSTMLSWAIDTEYLEPLGLTRGIYRTEISDRGEPTLLDMGMEHLWKGNEKSCFNVSKASIINITDSVLHRRQELTSKPNRLGQNSQGWCARGDGCAPHLLYTQLQTPIETGTPRIAFQGMWMLTKTHMDAYMKHPFWNDPMATKVDLKNPSLSSFPASHFSGHQLATRSLPNVPVGYPEKSTTVPMFIDTERAEQYGFVGMNVVPFIIDEHGNPRLALEAEVSHLRNGYPLVALCERDKALTF